MPRIPSPLLVVVAVAEPDGRAEQVLTLDSGGALRGPDGAGADRSGTDPGVDATALDRLGATGKAGEVHRLPDGRWLLGIGAADAAAARRAGAALSGALHGRADRADAAGSDAAGSDAVSPDTAGSDAAGPLVGLGVAGLPEEVHEALVIGLVLGSHRFRVSRTQPPPPGRVQLVAGAGELDRLVDQVRSGTELAAATALARDLASTPSDVKSPTWLVETAAGLAGQVPGLTATVWRHDRLVEEGFGGMLAVGGGSSRPPALLRLDWAPPGGVPADPRHLVLVGKGITFDTGGISIKPADGMHLMRTDMAGGAAVIGAVLAVARLGLAVRVTALVPAAENHVSGSAYRPGDIVRHYDGTTTEVVNTDAEGRMVLADALGYAVRELAPDLIVDAATLTGAMKVSLGLRTGGLFATDDELSDALVEAGTRTGERWWRMPLLDHVDDEVPSEIADIRQAPPGPGAIGAAQFLRRFTGGLPWVHLDIAGPARCEKPYDEVASGATGFAARTMVELARGLAGR
ncbi:MAG TPA: M17 family metallopeptidase [Pseudonocardia sp.]